ncbi:unnamed protein product [Cuscuta europaea]|uniref:Uncharacterized protein n=1 Tax=Cuscuta europaea TaxID=41803 RepID=A0A9P1EHU0_CUSEU|nr:unnamed protein product [Cuscuta europaea]
MMNVTPAVFDLGETLTVWRLVEGVNLNSNWVVEGLARVIWSSEVVKDVDGRCVFCPPPEPPPQRNYMTRVWKTSPEVRISLFYQLKFSLHFSMVVGCAMLLR